MKSEGPGLLLLLLLLYFNPEVLFVLVWICLFSVSISEFDMGLFRSLISSEYNFGGLDQHRNPVVSFRFIME